MVLRRCVPGSSTSPGFQPAGQGPAQRASTTDASCAVPISGGASRDSTSTRNPCWKSPVVALRDVIVDEPSLQTDSPIRRAPSRPAGGVRRGR
jgi:hypothetical protein